MTPKEAAQKYVSDTWTTVQDGIPEYARVCFLAGARFERERILGMMRSAEAGLWKNEENTNEEWADWIEKKLEEPK